MTPRLKTNSNSRNFLLFLPACLCFYRGVKRRSWWPAGITSEIPPSFWLSGGQILICATK